MAETDGHALIVGAGHAGAAAAGFLRQYGWAGPITLLSQEPHLPYQRPPLSKAWLQDAADEAALLLRPAHFYADQRITLRRSVVAVAIDRAARTLRLADNETLSWDRLILALGAVPRRLKLPGADRPGVLMLRTRADAEAIRAALRPGQRMAVVGGGYIGLEVAASARGRGLDVTVIEREARLLARVASPALSAHVAARHAAAGVTLLSDADVAALEGPAGGAVTGVRLADGRLIGCDLALVGVGAVPCTALAEAAGLVCRDGIVVDAAARTSDPAIHAIGDCTHRPLPLYGRSQRLESVPSAVEQAKQAAADLCGRPPPAPEVPWFWSDQYDMRLQIAGLPHDAVRTVVRARPGGGGAQGELPGGLSGGLAVLHLDTDNRLQAIEAADSPADFAAGRMLIGRRATLHADRLADPSAPLATLTA